ncbi:anthrone oxygenase family protein [Leifsonia poae]|uniref:anthrone oxygenase family protein n=1 Tax=Leifsonia poae TaxID=110933 RepID=UPI001CBF07EE|nr:anthrone oxygenase family protein [Leifsonia poae]
MIRPVLRFLSDGFTGLFAGFLVGVLVFELSLRRFDGSVYAQTQQVTLIALPVLASALLIPAIITTGALVALQLRVKDLRFWLTLGALVLLLVALVVTLVVNVPINLAEGGWSVSSPPHDWAATRDRWQIGHAVRTVAAVLAFGLLGVVAQLPRPAAASTRR